MMLRIHLPFHLRGLAGATGEVELEPLELVTQRTILDALEAKYPQLRGTIREHGTLRRRAFIRFFACQQDVSNDDPDAPLPAAIAAGEEAFLVIGALSGG